MTTPTSSPTASITSAIQGPTTAALTDTLHLLDAPHVTGLAPDLAEPLRTPLQSTAGTVQTTPVDYKDWQMPRPATLTYLTGTARFWIEYQGTVVANPVDSCFWRISLHVANNTTAPNGNPTTISMTDAVCVGEPEALPTGIRALEVTFPGRPIPDGSAANMTLEITHSGRLAPGASVNLLSGTIDHDSTLTLNGLQVPLTTQTYL